MLAQLRNLDEQILRSPFFEIGDLSRIAVMREHNCDCQILAYLPNLEPTKIAIFPVVWVLWVCINFTERFRNSI